MERGPSLEKETIQEADHSVTHINSHVIVYKLYRGVDISLKRTAGSLAMLEI